MIGAVIASVIFGKMHFLLISENEFFHEINCNRISSLMEFMTSARLYSVLDPNYSGFWRSENSRHILWEKVLLVTHLPISPILNAAVQMTSSRNLGYSAGYNFCVFPGHNT